MGQTDPQLLQSILRGTLRTIGQLIVDRGMSFDPAPSSIAVKEIAWEGKFAHPLSTHPVQDAYSIAFLRLSSAGNHLESLARQFEGEPQVFGTASLARTVLENAARAWWLLDPKIKLRTRIARGANERLNSLVEVTRYPIPAMSDEGKAQIDEFATAVESAGFFVVRDRKTGDPIAVEKRRPDATDLIRAHLGTEGEIAYRDLSAVAHGTQHGMTSRVDRVMGVATKPGISVVAPTARIQPLLMPVALAVIAFWETTDRRFYLYGWKSDNWLAWKTESGRALRRLLST